MQTFKHFIESTKMPTTTNAGYGYSGRIKDDPKAYAKMHGHVKKILHKHSLLSDEKYPNKKIVHFLDSTHGRHLADNNGEKDVVNRWKHFNKHYDPEDWK